MIIDVITRTKLIVIAVLFVIVVVFASLLYRQSQALASVSAEYDSTQGDDSAPDSSSWLYLTNSEEFYKVFPSGSQTAILNKIYARHYELYGTIARDGEIKGDIKTTNGRQFFTVLMGKDKHPLRINVKIKNAATNDFDAIVEKGES